MSLVLVGGVRHEVHSFVAGVTGIDVFERSGIGEGAAMFDDLEGTELAGALRIAEEHGHELLPTLLAYGGSGPRVDEACYEQLTGRILRRARDEVGRIDAVYLPLHGAMATTERDDPEGDLIHAIRAIVGPRLPIVVSVDLHAHLTDRMVSGADAIISYRTCPHSDISETGARAMTLVCDALAGRSRPVTAHRKIRLMSSSEAHDTSGGPLTRFQARARMIEQEPGVLAVSILTTQPWMDVPEVGWSALVTTDADVESAQMHADALATELWDGREEYAVVKSPIPAALEVVARQRSKAGPVVLADGADSTSAGAHGDGTSLLAEILTHPVDLEGLLIVTDADSARAAAKAGVGADVDLALGGHLSPDFFAPLPVRTRVLNVTDGPYRSKYPPNMIDGGLTAVVRIRNTTVVITEHSVPQLDLEPYARLGLSPAAVDFVQAKSAGGFRAYYTPIATAIVDLDTRGPCDSDLTRLPFTRITRPLWPFDKDLAAAW